MNGAEIGGQDAVTLESWVYGGWHRADDGFDSLFDPSTGQVIARASSQGVDFARAVTYAREVGGPALRALTFGQRAGIVKAMSKALRTHREALLEDSRRNHGTTAGDGSFDIDGASGTLAYYASLGRDIGDRHLFDDGDGAQLGKTEGFYLRHVWAPRHGVVVAINAFNFPVWGFAEKAACALLAGMPMIIKPATATALVAERAIRALIDSDILPEGALQLICGSTGDLLDHLGGQDVLAFTGSAETARKLRGRENLLAASTRVNVEADSLNAAVLAPDVEQGSTTFDLFIRDVAREMTQKSGQKCTAVRRIVVPESSMDAVAEALGQRLARVVVGNPADSSVRMGPLASADQLEDAIVGVTELRQNAELVFGSGARMDGVGSPEGRGFFFGPTLLRAATSGLENGPSDPIEAVHRREVFGPVATLLPYTGSAEDAAAIVGLGGGTLVTSAYSDDDGWISAFLPAAGPHTGRIYLGSAGSAEAAFGSGAALPQALHGGPGRAGGGEELGGARGLELYLQRVAVQGDRPLLDASLDGQAKPS